MADSTTGALALFKVADNSNCDLPPLPGKVMDASMDFECDVRFRLLSIERKLDNLTLKCPSAMGASNPANCNSSSRLPSKASRLETEPQSILPGTNTDSAIVKALTAGSLEVLDCNTNKGFTAINVQGQQQQFTNVGSWTPKHEVDSQRLKAKKRAWSQGLTRIYVDENREPSLVQRMSGYAMTKLENARQTVMKDRAQHWSWKCVHSTAFQVMTSTIIVCNAIAIGLNIDAELKAYMRDDQPGNEWAIVDTLFAIVFGAELLARAFAERWLFFFGVEWMWNFFDTLLTVLSLVNLIFSSNDMSNFVVARMVRFVRFIRLVRLARAVRAVQSLRLFILSIFASGMSLIWCLLIVSVIVYFFASIILSGVIEYFRNPHQHGAAVAPLEEFYGSVWRTMVTLFMSISGGVSWREPLKPLVHVHWAFEPAFTTFIFFMFFCVLNIVVGAFVTATSEISQRDREFLINAELEHVESYTRNIQQFFTEADKDMSGMLSWDEFEEHLTNPKVSAYFASFELDVSHAHRLFKLLDVDGSGQVSSDEFLDGCRRLKGTAKNIDVNMLVYEVSRMSEQVSVLMESMMNMMNSNAAVDRGSADSIQLARELNKA